MLLLIDNYDSFTWNLAHRLGELGTPATVVRNGKVDIEASYEVVRRFVEGMAQPKAADLMLGGGYEVAGHELHRGGRGVNGVGTGGG